jgi:hypothetical protein
MEKIDFFCCNTAQMNLFELARDGDLDSVQAAITAKNALQEDGDLQTPLHGAAHNSEAVLRYVLKCTGGNGIHRSDAMLLTPLHHAAICKNIKCFSILLRSSGPISEFNRCMVLWYVVTSNDSRECAYALFDSGLVRWKLSKLNIIIPEWLQAYFDHRDRCRYKAILLMGLRKRRQTILDTQPADVIRLIAQELWALRNAIN